MAAIRHNLQAFLLGGVTAFGYGYYHINNNVWNAAEAVDSRLTKLGEEAVSSQKAVLKRVEALEDEVSKLKGALAAAEEKAKPAE